MPEEQSDPPERRGLTEHAGARAAPDRPGLLRWCRRGAWQISVIVAVVWVLLILRLWDEHPWAVPGYLAVAAVAVVLAEIDWRMHLLPNRLTYPAFGVAVVLLGAAGVLEGEPARILHALGAAGVAGVVFALLAWCAGMGFGDVKFALTLAAALGWLSWSAVLVGAVVAFVLGGLAGVVAVVIRGRDRRVALAFGPWMALGALVGVLVTG